MSWQTGTGSLSGLGKAERLSQNCIELLFTTGFVSNNSLKQKYSGFYFTVRTFGNPKWSFMYEFEESGFSGCKRSLSISLNLIDSK